MTITHAFVSAQPDGANAALVQPQRDWNAGHVIAAATITKAHIENMATQRVLGRNTGGAGVSEEVTAGQLLDWASTTTGAILARFGAGSWSAITNIASDGSDLLITPNASPSPPAAGKVTVGAVDLGGRILPSAIAALGAQTALAPHLSQKAIGLWIPNGGGATTLVINGIQNAVAVGTATARTPAAGSIFAGSRRIGYVSAAGAGNVAGVRTSTAPFWLGNVAGAGGFHFVCRFGISDAVIVNGRMFVGLQASSAGPTDVNPSTFANMLGIGCDGGDTALQLYASGAAAQARTSLGANFPVTTTSVDMYELMMYAAPNAAVVTWKVTRINTGHTASGTISAAASLPASTTFLAIQVWRANNAIASAVGIDLHQVYIESDY